MILQRLHLLHFKSIASASCTFSPKVNCFIGLNGMGKTNLLDALHYLSFTKSHLSITDSLAVQYGQEAAVLDAVYRSDFGDERQLLLQIRPGHRKVLKRNKKEYPKLSDHIGAFPLVIVSPQDYQLILGGSDERRRFVDKQLSQQDSVYMAALAQYHRILEQRNVLLKSQRADDAVLEVLDLQLEQVSPLLYERRAAFVRDFIPLFQQYYTAISGGQDRVSLVYTSSLAEYEGHCLELLREARQRDRLMGYTTMGLHKDDLQMLLGEELIRKVGSEGQNKTFLIALKFAQYALLSATNPERPLLLLDDIFDKLDAERVSASSVWSEGVTSGRSSSRIRTASTSTRSSRAGAKTIASSKCPRAKCALSTPPMKQSKTVLLGEAIASLWDDDPDMYEQLLVHRLRDYLPELLGPMYRWLQEVRFDEGVLRLQVSSSAVRQELGFQQAELQRKINGHLGAELVRFIQIY